MESLELAVKVAELQSQVYLLEAAQKRQNSCYYCNAPHQSEECYLHSYAQNNFYENNYPQYCANNFDNNYDHNFSSFNENNFSNFDDNNFSNFNENNFSAFNNCSSSSEVDYSWWQAHPDSSRSNEDKSLDPNFYSSSYTPQYSYSNFGEIPPIQIDTAPQNLEENNFSNFQENNFSAFNNCSSTSEVDYSWWQGHPDGFRGDEDKSLDPNFCSSSFAPQFSFSNFGECSPFQFDTPPQNLDENFISSSAFSLSLENLVMVEHDCLCTPIISFPKDEEKFFYQEILNVLGTPDELEEEQVSSPTSPGSSFLYHEFSQISSILIQPEIHEILVSENFIPLGSALDFSNENLILEKEQPELNFIISQAPPPCEKLSDTFSFDSFNTNNFLVDDEPLQPNVFKDPFAAHLQLSKLPKVCLGNLDSHFQAHRQQKNQDYSGGVAVRLTPTHSPTRELGELPVHFSFYFPFS